MNIPTFYDRITFIFVAIHLALFLLCSQAFSKQKSVYPIFQEFSFPKTVKLCGEKIPLENRRIWEMLDREFTIMVHDRAQIFMWLKRAGRYFPYIEKKLDKAGLPGDLKYLAVAESSLLPHIRSSKGAKGLWQFMAHTARHNGLRKDHTMDERRNFELSTDAALKLLKRLKIKLGTWTLALAAYNYGEAKLKREIAKQKVKDYYRLNLPMETERFIFRITAIKIIMENPRNYGYHLSPENLYRPIKCDVVPVKIPRPLHMTDVAKALRTDFKILKELNPKIIGHYLPTGRYTLKVPTGLGAKTGAAIKKLISSRLSSRTPISGKYHVVQPGDTLSHIAKRTGISIAKLKRYNGITGSLIMVGKKLRLTP